jgi:hypothetical protein
MKKKRTFAKDEQTNSCCSIYITCGKPSKDGKMNVEMTCQGDMTLAGYLVSQAAQYLSEREVEQDECLTPSTISRCK